MKTWHKVAIALGALVVVLGAVGGIIFYNLVKDDAPAAFTLDTVGAASVESTSPAAAPSTSASPSTAAPAPETTAAAATDPATSRWAIDGASSQVGYRVVEVLFGVDTEGVGRTSVVTGDMTIDGARVTAADFTVDMTTVVSDENRRDNQFNGNLLETATFPTATFTLTAPIDLGGPPADATPVSATATGDLTLKDTTRSVTFDVQAQRDGDSIQVVGSTDILFADYSIPRPDVPGITTQDHGLLEFDLRFVPG